MSSEELIWNELNYFYTPSFKSFLRRFGPVDVFSTVENNLFKGLDEFQTEIEAHLHSIGPKKFENVHIQSLAFNMGFFFETAEWILADYEVNVDLVDMWKASVKSCKEDSYIQSEFQKKNFEEQKVKYLFEGMRHPLQQVFENLRRKKVEQQYIKLAMLWPYNYFLLSKRQELWVDECLAYERHPLPPAKRDIN